MLKIGVAAAPITPFLGAEMEGYYFPRSADGVHDHLWAKSIVLDDGLQQIALVACDLVEVRADLVQAARRLIQENVGIRPDHVMISATHTHTAPKLTPGYSAELSRRIADSVQSAAGSMTPARLHAGSVEEPSWAHNRRYRMKDGHVVTNPGFLNGNVLQPNGPIDPRLAILYAESEGHNPLFTWINYALHLDTVGGTWLSADYPYYLGKHLARVKGADMTTVFTIGCAGDVNHWNVSRPGPQRGHQEAQRIGEVLGQKVSEAYPRLEALSSWRVQATSVLVDLPTQRHTPEELEEARRIAAQPPRDEADFTLDRVKAARIIELEEKLGSTVRVEIQALAVGPVAFVGIPGEFFAELGLQIRHASPFPHTVVVTLANDWWDYIPTRTAYGEGAYEDTSARLAAGGGEAMVQQAVALLCKLKVDNTMTVHRKSCLCI